MAGKGRSLVETIAFIFFYPNKEKLFDFGNWPKGITRKIPEDLKKCLKNNHSVNDIYEYVRLRRPNVKKPSKIDSNQTKLLKIIELHKKWC